MDGNIPGNIPQRTTPDGLAVSCLKEAFDVKYAATAGKKPPEKQLPLSMEAGCRQCLSVTIGEFRFNLVERSTCGARYRGQKIRCPEIQQQAAEALLLFAGVQVSPVNQETLLPDGVPSFDLLERIAQRKQDSQFQGGVLV